MTVSLVVAAVLVLVLFVLRLQVLMALGLRMRYLEAWRLLLPHLVPQALSQPDFIHAFSPRILNFGFRSTTSHICILFII